MRYVAYEPTRMRLARPSMSSRPRSRATDRCLTVSLADPGDARSATVALLVLRPGPAPARVVTPDPGPARGESRPRPTRRGAGPTAHDRLVAERFAHRRGGWCGGTAPEDRRAAGGAGRGCGTRRDEVRGRRRRQPRASTEAVAARPVGTVAAREGSRS